MSGSIGANAYGPTAVAEWNVKLAIPEAQAVYSAAWPLTIVPLDSTSYVRLTDAEREGLRDAGTPLTLALEALLRLWADGPESRMTLHDQLALAEAQHPGRFFARTPVLTLKVDAQRLHAGRSLGPPCYCLPRAQARRVHEALSQSVVGEVRSSSAAAAAAALRESRRWLSDSAPHAKTPPRTNQLSVTAKITA